MRLPAMVLPLVSFAVAATAQGRVALPHGIGQLEVPVGWTALGHDELSAESRPSDPKAEPARTLVTRIVAQMRTDQRTHDNVLLHASGLAPGQVRTINAYSAAVEVHSSELQDDRTIERIRSALEQALTAPGLKVVFLGSDRPAVFAVGAISLTHRLEIGDLTIHNQMFVVPAGERLAYFETQFLPEDIDAPVAIANVLRSFDGAEEPPDDDLLRKMLIGGAAGAIAGITVALIRRRRQMRPRIGTDEPR